MLPEEAKIITLLLLRYKVMHIGHLKKTHTLEYLMFETVRLLSVKNNSRPVYSFFLLFHTT